MRQLLVLLFMFFSFVTYSQSTDQRGSISGIVLDSSFEESPVYNASVKIDGSFYSANSNIKGEFTINKLRPGNYTLTIRYLGYEKTVIENIEVKPGKTSAITTSIKSLAIAFNSGGITEASF